MNFQLRNITFVTLMLIGISIACFLVPSKAYAGDATLANQTTILSRIGTNTDSYSPSAGGAQVKVGSISSPASTGNQATTGVGFQPKLVIFIASPVTSDGLNNNDHTFFGAAVSSSSRFAIDENNDLDKSTHTNTKAFTVTGSSTLVDGDLVSMDSDGFTVNWTTVSSGVVVNYIAIGGNGVTNAAITQFTSPTATGNQSTTGVGFKPDTVLLASIGQATAPPNTFAADTPFALGAMSSSGDQGTATRVYDVSARLSYQTTSSAIATLAGGVKQLEASYSSMDPDGFTLNWSTVQATPRYIWAISLKGGLKVGSFNKPTATGNSSVTGVGFQPSGEFFWSFVAPASAVAADHNSRYSFGFASSSSNRGTWATSNINTNRGKLSRTLALSMDDNGTIVGEADFVSHDADGFTMNWTTADANAYQVLYLAFSAGPGTLFSFLQHIDDIKVGTTTDTGDEATLFGRIGVNTDNSQCFGTKATWDVSGASYASKSFSTNTQDTAPRSVFFKPDGLTMYVLGANNNFVYQYSLSTAWDVSTASYASKSFSISQDTAPRGMFFKSGGTKMYLVGFTNKVVYQYSLSTPWDISTASYASKSFSVNFQDASPFEVFFTSNGLTMYMVGFTNKSVYQYTLSTAWDVSTASYASKSVSVNSQDTQPLGVFFKPDGTTMYIMGGTNSTLYQYTLSTAWDVSTASYASKSFSVSSQDTSPYNAFYRPEGTNVYVMGGTNKTVYQYSMPQGSSVNSMSCSNETLFGIIRNLPGRTGNQMLSQFGGDGNEGTIPASGAIASGIHQYSTGTVSGALSPSDGSSLFIYVKGNLTVASGGNITVTGQGGKGGNDNAVGDAAGGVGGGGGPNGANASAAVGGAGGAGIQSTGGTGGTQPGCSAGGGGGGGSNGSGGGGGGGGGWSSSGACVTGGTATAIKEPGLEVITRQLLKGTGGGGGAGGQNGWGGGNGGNGGGVLYIEANAVTVNSGGAISAAGGNGASGGASAGGGGGGGGGGGTLWIRTHSYSNSGTVTANGGINGVNTGQGSPSGKGANGTLLIEIVP